MSDFFRPEVALRRRRGDVGEILLVPPLSLAVAASAAAIAAVALGAWLTLGAYTRTVSLVGRLVPDGRGQLRAECFASTAMVGRLRAGQAVELRFPTLPPASTDGTRGAVLAVERAPLGTGDVARRPGSVPDRASSEPVYRIIVGIEKPMREAGLLDAGVPVEAFVRVERRRLIAWLFPPLARAAAPA